ncbi:MAG: hypothetical protein ACI4PF_04195 [Christensenellales bacterium]
MNNAKKTKRAKCLQCGNYMTIYINDNGSESGKCPSCKAVIYSRQRTLNEKIIKITTN